MSKNFQQLFAGLEDDYNKASTNDGQGSMGIWPSDPGKYELLITRMEGPEAQEISTPSGRKVNCSRTQFFYRLLDPSKDPNCAEEFGGAAFIIPLNFEDMKDEPRRGPMEAELARLKQHLKVILGSEGGSLAENLQATDEALNSEASIVVVADLQHRHSKGKTYKTEFLLNQLEADTA